MALRLPTGGLFRHIKTGHIYKFAFFAINTENTKEYAVYYCASRMNTWCRPIEEFTTDRFENLNKVEEPVYPSNPTILDISELR